MDYEQLMGTILLIAIVSIPVIVILLGPVIGGKKVEVRDLRPLLIEAVNEFVVLNSVRKKDYEQFEKDMIHLLYERIQNTNIFREDEKSILSEEIIRILVRPYLQKIYKQK